MLNNIVGYWAYIQGTYIQGGAYIWNEVSISTCSMLIHRELILWGGGGGGLIFRGLRYTVDTQV
jgi:hypothetical protein